MTEMNSGVLTVIQKDDLKAESTANLKAEKFPCPYP